VHAPLWCKSNFSFLEGASHPEELVEEAHRLGIGSIALTDRDGVYGMVRAHRKARELGVHLVCGAQLSVAAPGVELVGSPVTLGLHGDDAPGRGPGWGDRDDADPPLAGAVTGRRQRARRPRPRQIGLGSEPGGASAASPSSFVVVAVDRPGWANLTRLVTAGRRRCDKGAAIVAWSELCRHAAGLIALWGGESSLLAGEPEPPAALCGELRDAFGDRLYAMAVRHRQASDAARELRVRARALAAGLPVVAASEVLYHSRGRRPLQDVVTCIRHGVTLATAGRRIRGNDEHDLRAPHAFARLFADEPGAVARTLEVAARCRFSLADLRYRYPSERLPGGTTSAAHLRALAYAGAARRFAELGDGEVPPAVYRQLDAELALIEELDYPGYFLTMYEIVSYCGRRGILCQGRGSAANSAVCYCLGVTAVDPVRMGLLFERFLSRERAEPPDIDLDIEHERREEVIQHVYAVYGRDHAAMVCNVIRYRPRSAVRDVGKVLGIPETALDRAAKQLSTYGAVEPAALGRAGLAEHGARALDHLARLADEILEFPRHLSIHPGGFLLGHEPVHDIVPIENAAMAGRTVIQWDKDDLEELGLFKVDLLALGALHQLHLAFDLLRVHRGVELTMATIPAEDPDTYDMICTGDTVGTFQIESRAQMAMLPRLRPRTFYDLVIEVSLVRPGPISGGMVHPYLRRRSGLEPVEYPHPCLEPVLDKTLGVPLFQEQVMKLAMVAADYTPGEADQLRRDMAAWRRSGRIEQHRERLVGRMQQNGIPREFAERVFEQIRGFGEYGFPESHAASFALIAYATSYLRKHYLAEFTCSLLNAQPMGFYAPATIVGDAARHGLELRPIDVTRSTWDCTLELTDGLGNGFEYAVRMGLRWVKGVQRADVQRIVAARAALAFGSTEDFVRRAHVPARVHTALAEAGALAELTGADRRSALWQVTGWVARQADRLPVGGGDAAVRFDPLSELDEILWDYAASAHSTRGHPLAPLRAELRARGWLDARAVSRGRDGQRLEYVGIVICRQQPGTAAGVVFMTLEDETGFVNVVVWQQVFARHAVVLRTTSLLGITGRLQVQDGIVHLIAEHAWVPALSRAVAAVDSRDFH
jgi:error-prone DNA polymerase